MRQGTDWNYKQVVPFISVFSKYWCRGVHPPPWVVKYLLCALLQWEQHPKHPAGRSSAARSLEPGDRRRVESFRENRTLVVGFNFQFP